MFKYLREIQGTITMRSCNKIGIIESLVKNSVPQYNQ